VADFSFLIWGLSRLFCCVCSGSNVATAQERSDDTRILHTGKTFKQSVCQLHDPVACLLCPPGDPNNVLVNRSGTSQRHMAQWRCNYTHTHTHTQTHTLTSALDRTSRPSRSIPSEGSKVSMRKDLQAAEKTECSATTRNTHHLMIAEPLP
jgi:hypothetical protein